MLSRLPHLRATSRFIFTRSKLTLNSINARRFCRNLTTTCALRKEDDFDCNVEVISNSTQTFTESNTDISSTAKGQTIQNTSSAVDRVSRLDTIPNILEEFFQKPRCNGCGTIFQSENREKPGFIVPTKNPSLNRTEDEVDSLKPVICERCFNLKNYNKGSPVLTSPKEVVDFLSHISRRKALILYMVDITDLPGSFVDTFLEIVGPAKRIILVANKLDMLPLDGKPQHQLTDLHSFVWHQAKLQGLKEANLKDISLISTKTGFGLPKLVDKILEHWDTKGDIYLVGATNSGKTSLFNTLLDLTNAHKKRGDMVNRATVSRLPGTTLSLLRFGCGHWKLMKLRHRLRDGTAKYKDNAANDDEYDIDSEIIEKAETSYKEATNQTASIAMATTNVDTQECEMDVIRPEIVSDVAMKEQRSWFYDTPGILNENQVTNFLTMEELKTLHTNNWIVPRTYVLKPGQAFLLGGLARVDYNHVTRIPRENEPEEKETLTEANKSIYFTIFASPNLPIHVLNINNAEEFYAKHAGQQLLKVPHGGSERMASYPSLQGRDFTITGIGWRESAADVVLSNIGWVAMTAGQQAIVQVTAYTPNGVGLVLREPAVLPTSVNQRGKRGVRYQGHTIFSGYESHRKASPQLVKTLSNGHHGVYQWYREIKRKTKQQTAFLKAKKAEKNTEKRLVGTQKRMMLEDGYDGETRVENNQN